MDCVCKFCFYLHTFNFSNSHTRSPLCTVHRSLTNWRGGQLAHLISWSAAVGRSVGRPDVWPVADRHCKPTDDNNNDDNYRWCCCWCCWRPRPTDRSLDKWLKYQTRWNTWIPLRGGEWREGKGERGGISICLDGDALMHRIFQRMLADYENATRELLRFATTIFEFGCMHN